MKLKPIRERSASERVDSARQFRRASARHFPFPAYEIPTPEEPLDVMEKRMVENKRRSAAAASRQEAEKVAKRRKTAAFIEIWKH